MKNKIPEEEVRALLERVRGGDDKAFDDLVTLYYDKVFRLSWNIVKNEEDAKEVCQQTWVKVWRKLDTFRGQSAFYTWVYRIATFTAWDFLRKKKRAAEVSFLEEVDPESNAEIGTVIADIPRPDQQLAKSEIRETFLAALENLSEKHRTALILREVEGLSYEEIANVMQCRKGTVMSRIFNARRAMQEYLKEWKRT